MNITFETTDVVLAGFLRVNHIHPSNIIKTGKRSTFHFDHTEELKKLIDEFDRGASCVEPVSFYSAVKNVIIATQRG